MRSEPLNALTLDSIRATGVGVPTYNRNDVKVGIVHIGVGGFHRAHEAMVIDRLLGEGGSNEWGISGIGVLPVDAPMRDAMSAQDNLYTLMVKHPDGSREARIIGSIVEYLFAPDDPERAIERMADPATRIVSLTITEGGYNFDQITGEFDSANAAIQADLVGGATPSTVFGLVTEALARRRHRGIAPFTVMSCDNIQGNGGIARRMFAAFASLRDPELGSWVAESVAFPNSMVDRITPATTDSDRDEIEGTSGVRDQWPVVCEPFFQWVVEDRFPAGRPAFEAAGVQVVDDVEPYELMKLRLLNASHQGVAYFGYLAGYRFVHEATADPIVATFLRRYMDEEATRTLHPVPGVDLEQYKDDLIHRFQNAETRDTLARLCAESSDRIPKWLVPVIRENLNNGGPVALSAAIVASWARYAEGIDERGEPIEVVDRMRDKVMERAKAQSRDPVAFLQDPSLFGDLAEAERFVEPYVAALTSLHELGSHKTLATLAFA